MHPSFLSPLSLTIYSLYLQLLQLWTKNRLLPSLSESSVQLIPCIPKHAALVRGLSDSSATRSRPRRPPLQSYAPRRSVRDCFRPLSTTQPSRALCSPLFPFTSTPHSHAALAIRQRHAGDCAGPVYNTSRPAEACKTACAASHPHKSLRTLDAFPSDQGKFRVTSDLPPLPLSRRLGPLDLARTSPLPRLRHLGPSGPPPTQPLRLPRCLTPSHSPSSSPSRPPSLPLGPPSDLLVS